MNIGYEIDTGHVYEGASTPEYAVVPAPLLTQATLIVEPADLERLPRGIQHNPTSSWVFREESFDPVSRIRRGLLFQPLDCSQPQDCRTRGHPANQFTAAGESLSKRLYAYSPCQKLINKPRSGHGMTLALGGADSWSAWRIVAVERIVGDNLLVTLKSLSAFGVLPELRKDAIPAEHRSHVERAIERVLDSAFRETAISVVDQCRNAVTVLLSRWLASKGEQNVLQLDLGQCVKRICGQPHSLVAAAAASDIIRILHPRGKANEQASKGLRLVQDEDAEASVHAVGFIMRELQWAM